MVHEFFGIHPRFFGIQCPTIFCDFGLFNRLAQAGGGGALLYDKTLPKTYRPKLLTHRKISVIRAENYTSETGSVGTHFKYTGIWTEFADL